MRLLKVLWQGRHVTALDALRYTGSKFWEHLMKPLFEDIPQSLQEEDQEVWIGYECYIMLCFI